MTKELYNVLLSFGFSPGHSLTVQSFHIPLGNHIPMSLHFTHLVSLDIICFKIYCPTVGCYKISMCGSSLTTPVWLKFDFQAVYEPEPSKECHWEAGSVAWWQKEYGESIQNSRNNPAHDNLSPTLCQGQPVSLITHKNCQCENRHSDRPFIKQHESYTNISFIIPNIRMFKINRWHNINGT